MIITESIDTSTEHQLSPALSFVEAQYRSALLTQTVASIVIVTSNDAVESKQLTHYKI